MAGPQAVWDKVAYDAAAMSADSATSLRSPLYTSEQRIRRDATRWTLVQGVLAPIQFLIFIVSLGLIVYALNTGDGVEIAKASVVVKTLTLYLIMITGSIWEKVVFDKWLFADAFYWEDIVSMFVLALHTWYLVALYAGWGGTQGVLIIALLAYASYVINAGQFLLKLRAARIEGNRATLITGAIA